MISADGLIQQGLAHHQAGRFALANDCYQQALQLTPNHPDALHLLGMLAQNWGDLNVGIQLIRQAIQLRPQQALYHCNLGTLLQAAGKLAEAIDCFQHALTLDGNAFAFHFNLAHALQQQGKLLEAQHCYEQAILINPQYIQALSNLAHVLAAQKNWTAAEENYRRALKLAPNWAELHFNLATALNSQNRLDEAIASYQQAVVLFADYTHAHCNLGAALLMKGELDAAATHLQRAIALNPQLAEAHFNLGNVRQAQNQLVAATRCYRQAVLLNPNFAEAYCNLGNALRAQGQLDQAIASYETALKHQPNYVNAYSNLLFLHSYHATLPPEQHLALARDWEQACVPPTARAAARQKVFQRQPLRGRRLKVGYVSGDFRQHAVSYFLEQVWAQHNRSRVELFAYSNNTLRDAVTARLNALVEHWQTIVGWTDDAVLERMAADELDVLIDLSGHSAHHRLGVFARRAAPVQATYLGYFASTGLSEMDYWLGDAILTPPEMDAQFSEHVWRLPRTWLAYRPLREAPPLRWQPTSDGTLWLGCFNHLGKLTPPTLQVWARLLHALPEANLLLKNKDLESFDNRQRILQELAALGVAASRIELQGASDWSSYMAEHDRLDLALDPIGGHGGGTSTCDALWMGVPVIHLLGDHVGSRFAASMLNALGQADWIAQNETDYIEKIVALARDVEQRQQLRLTQRERMANSPLCDAKGLATALEDAYFAMAAGGKTAVLINPSRSS